MVSETDWERELDLLSSRIDQVNLELLLHCVIHSGLLIRVLLAPAILQVRLHSISIALRQIFLLSWRRSVHALVLLVSGSLFWRTDVRKDPLISRIRLTMPQ